MDRYTPDLSQFKILSKTANLIPVYREISADLETPVSAYLKVAHGPHSFLLESVEGGENLARYSFIGTEPAFTVTTGPKEKDGPADPLELLRKRMNKIKYANVDGLPKFSGGAVGYVAYDAIKYFEEKVPPISSESTGLDVPESVFMLTKSLVIFDHVRHVIAVLSHATVNDEPEKSYKEAIETIERIIDQLQKPLRTSELQQASPPTGHFVATEVDLKHSNFENDEESKNQSYLANMDREYYDKMVNQARRYIFDGEIIQVVVSQRLSRKTTAKPFELYRSLRAINPSPYMFYLEMEGFQIIGASPELLCSVIDGEMAVHPIAGTRPRGNTEEEDETLENELLRDEKEIAEHLMLLDLGRNDIGRVCQPGTVKVTQQMEVERYSHVMHIVSHVTGQLNPQYDNFDALKAAFPAGTVSGAPKIRAMEIISELEPQKRGPYSGAVGYFSYTGNMDTAISLRTMIVKDGVAYLQAGGGIVADSVSQTEFDETLHKMGALMRAIDHAEESRSAR